MKKLLLTFTIATLIAFSALSSRTPAEISPLVSTTVSRVASTSIAQKPQATPFEQETALILDRLPRNQDIKDSPSHYAPAELMKSSEDLGVVMDAMRKNTAFVSTGMAFYQECALKTDVLEQVRALCLRNLYDWTKRNGTPLDLNAFPASIKRLASFIPETLF